MTKQRFTDDYRHQKCRQSEQVRHRLSLRPFLLAQRLKRHFPCDEGRYRIISSSLGYMKKMTQHLHTLGFVRVEELTEAVDRALVILDESRRLIDG